MLQGSPAVADSNRPIAAGFVGEVRRSVAGSRLEIDHRHDYVEFDLVVRGAGSCIVGDRSYPLKPGTVLWVLPGQRHRLVRTPALEMWVVVLRAELLADDRIAALTAQPTRQLAGQDLIDLDRLLSQVAQDSDDMSVYNAGLLYAGERAWRASRNSPSGHSRPMHAAVARALLTMRESGAEISLPELADAAGVTAPYLSRLLIEHTGRNFVDWRNRVRLNRFIEAWRPGTNLLNAALDAGFGSYARFHHVFVRIVGCAPSDWVHQAEQAEGTPRPELLPVDYGMPVAAAVGARQRWTQLLALISPALPPLLGQAPFRPLLTVVPGNAPRERAALDFDATLGAEECERLTAVLRPLDSQAAEELGRLAVALDFAGTYAGVLAIYGLSPTQVSDGVAALALALWVAANGSRDPSQREVEAVAQQVAGGLGARFGRADRRAAQDAVSALLCHCVVLYHAIQAARASGDSRDLEQLAQAARHFGRELFDVDLLSLELTGQGFARRSRDRPAI